jgi:hypothetical protein
MSAAGSSRRRKTRKSDIRRADDPRMWLAAQERAELRRQQSKIRKQEKRTAGHFITRPLIDFYR